LRIDHLLPLATFSISSFFLIAHDDWVLFFSALITSSARVSAMDLIDLKALSLHPLTMK
jgi:hypothetical protein